MMKTQWVKGNIVIKVLTYVRTVQRWMKCFRTVCMDIYRNTCLHKSYFPNPFIAPASPASPPHHHQPFSHHH